MASHIGIELSPGVCRIVEVELSRGSDGLRPDGVPRFATFRIGSAEMAAALAGLRGRSAAVVVWGAPGDHRQVMVTAGTYDAMRKEARRALAKAGVETRGAMVDIARAPAPAGAARRRPVVVALASGAVIGAALRPLFAAGIRVRAAATPAIALASLARVRRRFSLQPSGEVSGDGVPIEVDAYVAIDEMATCITLLRDGTIVAARELSWGFQEGRRGLLRRREDIAARLGDELDEFLATVGGSLRSVRQVTMCGGVPDLWSVAAMLTERFDVEAEPLDAGFAIDERSGDGAKDAQWADMWVAWAAATDQPPSLSLLHAYQAQTANARFARAAIAAGVVAGVGLGWQAARSRLLQALPLSAVHEPASPGAPEVPTTEVLPRDHEKATGAPFPSTDEDKTIVYGSGEGPG